MIAHVRGRVAGVSLNGAVVEVGGVGLQVHCTPGTLAGLRVGEEAMLPTSLVVREESLTLFGFADPGEKEIFELVQTASGVGPKVAQAIVAVMAPDDVRRAIAGEDVKALTKVPGIGPKGAQRIILELKDKVGIVAGSAAGAPVAAVAWRVQVVDGLVGLGWSAKESEKAVDAVVDTVGTPAGATPDVAVVLRAALRALSKA